MENKEEKVIVSFGGLKYECVNPSNSSIEVTIIIFVFLLIAILVIVNASNKSWRTLGLTYLISFVKTLVNQK